jgi:peptide/nickel transport system permease protein
MLDNRIEATRPRAFRGLLSMRGAVLAVVDFSKRKPLGAIGGGILTTLILIAILAPVISPFDPEEIHREYLFAPPGGFLPLGGDSVGRDVMSRLFYGARVSLFVGLVSVGIGITGGSLLGVTSAYLGGKFDLIVQRFVDAFIAFPGIILALAIVAVLGSSVTNIIIAIVMVLAPGAIRTVRSQALAVKEQDYVLAARGVGAGDVRIVLRHMAPNCMAIFIILSTLQLGSVIIIESSLSFLGVGVPPEVATWGSMLAEGGITYIREAPWLAAFPGIALSLAVFGFNLLGDALRDVMDPRLRGTG